MCVYLYTHLATFRPFRREREKKFPGITIWMVCCAHSFDHYFMCFCLFAASTNAFSILLLQSKEGERDVSKHRSGGLTSPLNILPGPLLPHDDGPVGHSFFLFAAGRSTKLSAPPFWAFWATDRFHCLCTPFLLLAGQTGPRAVTGLHCADGCVLCL